MWLLRKKEEKEGEQKEKTGGMRQRKEGGRANSMMRSNVGNSRMDGFDYGTVGYYL